MFWRPLIAAAATWSSLPQLQQLDIQGVDLRQHWQLELLLSSLAAATQLTSLSVANVLVIHSQPVRLCAAVQALPNLASLALEGVFLAKSDLVMLTRVTQLTSLSLVNCSSAVDDVAAVALCSHLSKLEHLSIVSSQGLVGMGMLYPISAQLSNLQSLSISGCSSCVSDAVSLNLLSRLTKLTQISIPGNPDSLAMAAQGLRMAAPGLGRSGISIHAPVGNSTSPSSSSPSSSSSQVGWAAP